MKKPGKLKTTLLLTLVIVLNGTSTTLAQDLTQHTEFGDNPGNLKMFTYIPSEPAEPSTKRPLVVALHGCSQTTGGLSSTTEWNEFANDQNFVMLYPSQKVTNNPSFCFNWFMEKDISKYTGELASIINMIDYSINNFNIDTSRIYIYGLSAGAAMGVALMAVYPEYFHAGAIFAGAPYKTAVNPKEGLKAMMKVHDKRPDEWGRLVTTDSNKVFPRLIVCHGTNDMVVNFKNSQELVEQWTYIHHMDAIPDAVIEEYENAPVVRESYLNARSEEQVVFYKFIDVGHVIPIDPGTDSTQGGKDRVFSKDINFNSTYYMAKEFGLFPE